MITKFKKLSIDILDVDIIVYYGDITKASKHFETLYSGIAMTENICEGCIYFWEGREKPYVLYVRDIKDLRTIVHEVTHLIHVMAANSLDMTHDESNTEFFAYSADYLFSEISNKKGYELV